MNKEMMFLLGTLGDRVFIVLFSKPTNMQPSIEYTYISWKGMQCMESGDFLMLQF